MFLGTIISVFFMKPEESVNECRDTRNMDNEKGRENDLCQCRFRRKSVSLSPVLVF